MRGKNMLFPRRLCVLITITISVIFCNITDAGEAEETLRVGISPFAPFVILSGDQPIGVSIDIWHAIADKLRIEYEYVESEGVDGKLKNLKEGKTDIAIGGITITQAREGVFDFTHPHYHTGLDILIPYGGRPMLIKAFLSSLFTREKFYIILLVLFFVVVAGHIIWLAERSSGKRKTGFSSNYFPGVFEGMYWTLITVSTIGYGDKVPKKWAGRILACILILLFLPLFGYFIAQLSSDLTMHSLRVNINGPEDLVGRRVGVVSGTTSDEYMSEQHAVIYKFNKIEYAYKSLLEGLLDAVVYDAPNLLYYAHREGKGKVKVVGKLFDLQDYGVALRRGSDLRKRINLAILDLIESGKLHAIKVKWFGHEAN
jgi:ABC-type amino acid transport substrate-binding protein